MDDLTRLLSALVAIPSVNPMGRASSGHGYFETALTDYLDAWLADLDVPRRRDEVARGRDNLLAWYRAPRSDRLILFDVHQDTVPADRHDDSRVRTAN